MSKAFVFIWMLFNHVLDDYCLQGILATMKQKSWWEENYPNLMYKNDYIVALIMHSISWSFMILLPIAVYHNFNIDIGFIMTFIWNVIVHAFIDNLKANKLQINLIFDQTVHIFQIILTFMGLIFY